MYEGEIYFLGSRDYVHSTTIINYALLNLKLQHGLTDVSHILIQRYKQIEKLRGPFKLVSADQAMPDDHSQRGTILTNIGDRSFTYNIIAISGEIARQPEINLLQRNYHEEGDTTVNATLTDISDFWKILYDVVQLTKTFHINQYNKKRQLGLRFLVGGFEKLRGFEPEKNELFKITSKIINHSIFRDKLYNQILIDIESNLRKNSFLMQFIGKQER
jgi:hypothetical protein